MADARFVRVEGLRLRVSIRGAGSPLLLLNGLGASLELLERFRQAIRGHETIALDLPGVGRSDTAVLPMRFRSYARLVAGALRILRYDQVDVLGVSWGGALAQEFAWRHPAHVRRLVLAATTYGIPSVPASPRTLWELATPRRYRSRSHFEKVAPALYGGVIDAKALVRELRFGHPPTACGYAGQLFATVGWSSLPYLWRLAAPDARDGGGPRPDRARGQRADTRGCPPGRTSARAARCRAPVLDRPGGRDRPPGAGVPGRAGARGSLTTRRTS